MHQGGVQPGQWVAVHGTGGVDLSAVQIAGAVGAQTIAVDIDDAKLKKAVEEGAVATVNGNEIDVGEAIKEISGGGVQVSVAALGRKQMVLNFVSSLRKGGAPCSGRAHQPGRTGDRRVAHRHDDRSRDRVRGQRGQPPPGTLSCWLWCSEVT